MAKRHRRHRLIDEAILLASRLQDEILCCSFATTLGPDFQKDMWWDEASDDPFIAHPPAPEVPENLVDKVITLEETDHFLQEVDPGGRWNDLSLKMWTNRFVLFLTIDEAGEFVWWQYTLRNPPQS